jgi:hypothetical protein
MPAILKLDGLLSDADRAALNELVARPGTRIEDALKWVRDRGYDVGRAAVYAYVRRQRPDRPKMHRLSKLDKIIRPEDRPTVEAMCADPATTVADLYAFVQSKKYPISRVACWRHLRTWRHELEDIRRSARFARSLSRVAQDVGPAAFGAGAMLGFEQVVMEQVFQLREREQIAPADLTDWAATLERTIGVREQLETLRRGPGRAGRDTEGDGPDGGNKRGTGGKDPKNAKASKDAKGRPPDAPRVVNGVEIANCVRRILGVPLPGEPVPEPPRLPPPVKPEAPALPLRSAGEGRGEGGA